MDRIQIAANLRSVRERLGFTQAEVAARLGMHRPTISEIEAGRRAVTSEELFRLARLYATPVGSLLNEPTPDADAALHVLFRGDDGFTPAGRAAALRFVERCRAERELEELLGAVPHGQLRPGYQVEFPSSKMEAVTQGERVAAEERRRLDLGSEPIRNIFELIEAQGIHLGPIEDGDDLAVDGLYFETDDLGACIAVNPTRDQATGFRSAFTAAHEFAHWVLRDVMVEGFTFLPGSGDLREVRANAFAAAFLMPAAGLKEHFRRTGRLRENDLAPLEIGDLVRAMDRFGVSRTALLYRLQNIGLLEAESGERMRGEEWDILHVARALGIKLRRDRYDAGRLRELAIEAWRRGLVSTSRAADLTRTDIADFRRRMKVMGIKQQDDETVPLVGAATRR
jgi:Zn-dependent peptidase ImmA (M78 family)/transcriptional regulator with XRE-family HTH domain